MLLELLFGFTLNMVRPEPFDLPYIKETYVEAPPKFYDPPRSTWCSCVDTIKFALKGSVEESWGNASTIRPIPGLEPAVGLIGVTREAGGHIFLITDLQDGWITTLEGNYETEIIVKDSKKEAYSDKPYNQLAPNARAIRDGKPANEVDLVINCKKSSRQIRVDDPKILGFTKK